MNWGKITTLIVLNLLLGPYSVAGHLFLPKVHTADEANDLFDTERDQDYSFGPDQVYDLKTNDIDISHLAVKPTSVWQNQPLPLLDPKDYHFPPEGATLQFKNFLSQPSFVARSEVVYEKGESANNFRLVISVESKSALMRSALLRRLGYKLESPKRYKRLRIQFKNLKEREKFLSSLEQTTQKVSETWVKKKPFKRPWIELEDVILENYPHGFETRPYAWGILVRETIRGRRSVRSLIIPFALVDVPESVNLFSMELGKLISEGVSINYLYADQFQGETTYADARWIALKISEITREEWKNIVQLGEFPQEIAPVVFKRLLARRDNLLQIFEICNKNEWISQSKKIPCQFGINTDINNDAVKEGKVIQESFPGHASRFTVGDPESPLRFSELSRFFLIEGINYTIGKAVDEINKLLAIRSIDDVLKDHQEDLRKEILDHILTHPFDPFEKSLTPWVGHTYGAGVHLSRNVVTGTYYGSNSKAQLVDNVSLALNAGLFMGFDGVKEIIPSLSGNVSAQRNFLHLRPIPDIKTALKTSWLDLWAPNFFVKLKKILNRTYLSPCKKGASGDPQLKLVITTSKVPDYSSSFANPLSVFLLPSWKSVVNKKAYCNDQILSDEQATQLYTDFIEYLPRNKKTLVQTNWKQEVEYYALESELKKEIQKTQNQKNLLAFLETLKEGEMLVVADSITVGASANLAIPITSLLSIDPLSFRNSVSFGSGGKALVTQRITFHRTSDGIQVYLQSIRSGDLDFSADFQFWMNIFRSVATRQKGWAKTRAFHIPVRKDITDIELAYLNLLDEEANFSLPKDSKEYQNLLEELENAKNSAQHWRNLSIALQSLFSTGSTELLENRFHPYLLNHDVTAEISNRKFLAWKWHILETTHKLTFRYPVVLPDGQKLEDDPEKFDRTFVSHKIMRTKGRDDFSLLSDIVSGFANGWGFRFGQSGSNPANAFLGRGKWSSIETEAELTENRDPKLVTRIERHWGGWSLSKNDLLKIIKKIEKRIHQQGIDFPLVVPQEFHTMDQLQLYDIQTKLSIYQKGMQNLVHFIFPKGGIRELFDHLINLDGRSKYDRWKSAHVDRFGFFDPKEIRDYWENSNYVTLPRYPSWVSEVVEHRYDRYPENNREKQVSWMNQLITILESNLEFNQFIDIIGKKNYFFQITISGFRTNDENGDSQYDSHTLGEIDPIVGDGPFSELADDTELILHEVKANYLKGEF